MSIRTTGTNGQKEISVGVFVSSEAQSIAGVSLSPKLFSTFSKSDLLWWVDGLMGRILLSWSLHYLLLLSQGC